MFPNWCIRVASVICCSWNMCCLEGGVSTLTFSSPSCFFIVWSKKWTSKCFLLHPLSKSPLALHAHQKSQFTWEWVIPDCNCFFDKQESAIKTQIQKGLMRQQSQLKARSSKLLANGESKLAGKSIESSSYAPKRGSAIKGEEMKSLSW